MYTDPATVRLVLSSDAEETGGTAADLSDAQIQYEIDSAQALIDAHLRVRYEVPFNPVPILIKTICTDLAAYGADLNYRKSREYDSENMPIIRRYKAAHENIQNLKLGRITLDEGLRTDVNEEGAIVVHQYELPLFPPWLGVGEAFPRW